MVRETQVAYALYASLEQGVLPQFEKPRVLPVDFYYLVQQNAEKQGERNKKLK